MSIKPFRCAEKDTGVIVKPMEDDLDDTGSSTEAEKDGLKNDGLDDTRCFEGIVVA